MKTKIKIFGANILFVATIGVFLSDCQEKKQPLTVQLPKPNIIYILADDLGYGDLSCYGQVKFTTPNIDKLAQEGMRFTQHYSGSTVCAPSRSSLMTGLHTGHTPLRGNKEWKPEGQWPMDSDAFTLAEMFKSNGYTTGAFGKWGLGYPGSEGDPNNQGFDEFFGYNCQRLAHNYYPYYLWHNQEKVMLEDNQGPARGTYAPDRIHAEALKFLETNKDKPFFMYYPAILPHAELFAPEEYMAKFRGKFLPEKEYKGTDDGENVKLGPYGSQPEAHAAFAAMVTYLDDKVGEIVQKVHDLGLDKNTIIVFTSDNGPHLEAGADPDYFDSNGILKGYKRDVYEGGIRVPMIVRWPDRISSGTTTDHISAFWDVMPTMAELISDTTIAQTDGISFLPTLLGQDQQVLHDFLYWEFHELGGRMAVRKGDWKLVKYHVFDPEITTQELYNLSDDPGEEANVADQNPEIVIELNMLMQASHEPNLDFPFGDEQALQ
jgi:arylsulfatase A